MAYCIRAKTIQLDRQLLDAKDIWLTCWFLTQSEMSLSLSPPLSVSHFLFLPLDFSYIITDVNWFTTNKSIYDDCSCEILFFLHNRENRLLTDPFSWATDVERPTDPSRHRHTQYRSEEATPSSWIPSQKHLSASLILWPRLLFRQRRHISLSPLSLNLLLCSSYSIWRKKQTHVRSKKTWFLYFYLLAGGYRQPDRTTWVGNENRWP